MAEGKEKQHYVHLKGTSEGRATATGKLTVHTFGEYLVNRRVGIRHDEGQELQGYVDTWRNRDPNLSEAEAWSLVISVEMWRQARMAFGMAIGIGLLSILVAIGIFVLSGVTS